ncbi:MAG: hypothetical protein R2865_08770 [Deinococcales bacterium]
MNSESGIDGIGINGFATEAYKLSDQERQRTVDIVATELAALNRSSSASPQAAPKRPSLKLKPLPNISQQR